MFMYGFKCGFSCRLVYDGFHVSVSGMSVDAGLFVGFLRMYVYVSVL